MQFFQPSRSIKPIKVLIYQRIYNFLRKTNQFKIQNDQFKMTGDRNQFKIQNDQFKMTEGDRNLK